LLLYLFSISPAIIFHHHNYDFIAFDKAAKCEKAIYYADKDDSYNHEQHIAKASKRCLLCDNHTISAHTVISALFVCINVINACEHNPYNVISHSIQTSETSNRGPPTV